MKLMIIAVSAASTLLLSLTCVSTTADAATFSSTKVEVLYGWDYKRGPGFSETDEAIITVANASGFAWGDSFFFLDQTNVDDADSTSGTHFEFGPRYRFYKPEGDSAIAGFYGIVQADFTSNRFVQKIVKMAGVSVDWNVPGFKFVKTHVQYRNDPTLDGSSVQFNLVWNKSFKLGDSDFSFEGFADYTTSEGTTVANLLVQPQVLWHVNKNVGIGFEYQYWKNRLGIDGLNEKSPQVMVRWTF
jgi:hypothetical protein